MDVYEIFGVDSDKERKKVADRFLILKSGRTGLWYQP
jgi:hypothetical protein